MRIVIYVTQLVYISTLFHHLSSASCAECISNYTQDRCERVNNCIIGKNESSGHRHLVYCASNSTIIDLAQKEITHVCPNALSTANLTKINLSQNNISEIPLKFFGYLRNLRSLKLSHNRIKNLSKDNFSQLSRLVLLDLSNNQLGGQNSDFDSLSFTSLFLLQKLDLSSNGLQSVPFLKQQIFLRCLILSNNNLKEIPEDLLGGAKHTFPLLATLDLSGNPIDATLDAKDFETNENSSGLLAGLSSLYHDRGTISVTDYSGSCSSRVYEWGIPCQGGQSGLHSNEASLLVAVIVLVSSIAAFVSLIVFWVKMRNRKRGFSYVDRYESLRASTNGNYIAGPTASVDHLAEHIDLNDLSWRDSTSFPLNIWPVTDNRESFLTVPGERNVPGTPSDNLSAISVSTCGSVLSRGSLNLTKRKALNRKIRMRRSAKLKSIRSFSCNDLPKQINNTFYL